MTTRAETSKIEWRPTSIKLIKMEDHQEGMNTNYPHLSFTNVEMQDDHNEQGGDRGNKGQRIGDATNKELKEKLQQHLKGEEVKELKSWRISEKGKTNKINIIKQKGHIKIKVS